MVRVHSDVDGQVIACPECDEAGNVYERTSNVNAHAGDPEAPYHCQKCGATFYEYRERDAKPNASGSEPGQNGLARIMAEMTVDEFDAIVNGGESA